MTKRILAMLLAVVMVVGLLPMNVFAGTAADNTKYQSQTAHTDAHICEHCIAAGKTETEAAAVTWTAWNTTADPKTKLPTADGHYYLADDINITAAEITSGHVVLCLNGKTVTAAGTTGNANDRFYTLKNEGSLTIVDCTASGEGDSYKAGKLTGGSSSGIMFQDNNTTTTGSLNIYDAIFEGNSRSSSGGTICVQGKGKLNVYGGRFVDNSTNGGGGAIYLHTANNTAWIEDAQFVGNEAKYGGAFYAASTPKVTVKNCRFVSNESTNSTGGAMAFAKAATIEIEGSHFEGNKATTSGGAIRCTLAANMTIKDTTFTGNEGKDGAGAIYTAGPLTLENVTVQNNTTKGSTAANGLGAVSLGAAEAQTVTLKGNTVITGNTDGTANRNLYLSNAANRVAVDGLNNTTPIGLTLAGGMGTFAEGVTEAGAKDRFVSDVAGVYVHEQAGQLILSDTVPEPPHSHHVCGKDSCGDTTHTGVVFNKWGTTDAEKKTLPASGNYYLVADINMSGAKADFSGELNLCLHGHTITAKSGVRHMGISAGVTINITDCGANEGKIGVITGGANDYGGSINVNAGGTLNLYNGSFVNNKAKTAGAAGQGGTIYLQGTKNGLPGGVFNMYGGQIGAEGKPNKAYSGAAVYVAKDGTFNMQGGSIVYNEATMGAAIYTADIADVDVANAVINNNTTTSNGGAIYVASANSALDVVNTEFKNNSTGKNGGVIYTEKACTVNFTNCTFAENHANSGEGGVAYLKTAKTTFTGGSMEGNTAKNGSTLVVFGGTCVIDGAKIKNNVVSSSYGAVHMNRVDGKLSVTMKGATEISGNTTAAGKTQNVFMRNNTSYINLAGLTEGANIGVTMEDARMRSGYWNISADAVTAEQAGWIHSDNGEYTVEHKDNKARLSSGHNHNICASATCSDNHAELGWIKWTDTTKLPTTAGSYYLAEDVQLTGVQYIRNDVNICLNGKTVTAKEGARLISVQKYNEGTAYAGVLDITDCKGTGALTGGNSTFGGAINVQAGATLNLYGGNITGNQSNPENESNGLGGAIYLQSKTTRYQVGDKYYNKTEADENNIDITNITGTDVPGGAVNVYGGAISDNKAYDGAAILGLNGSQINIYGGTFSGNAATNFGGAICAKEGITVNIAKASFEGNTAKRGGAIYMTGADSKLNIADTAFDKNEATEYGGAILAQSTGTAVAIAGSTFTGNHSPSGGAVYISKKTTALISGTSFTGNTANNGAALYTLAASATLEDVQITGNTAAYNGAGVYMHTDAEALTLKGNVKILNNLADGRANNLYLTGTELISVDALADEAKIGISAEKFDRAISTQNDTDFSKKFISDSSYRTISYKDKALYLANSTEHTHCICTGVAASGCDHGSIVWLAWEKTNTLPTADGHYYLTKDVVMNNQIWVKNKNITICLNGHTVTAAKNARLISVQEGTVLNITDCVGGGKLTGGNSTFGGAINVNAGGTLNLFGGIFTGNQSNDKEPLPEKVTNMKGQGGAIYLQAGKDGIPGGVLNMYGGTVTGNKASLGAAIHAAAKTQLNIYGGTITDNEAVKYGGGVYTTGGNTTNIANAKFEGNTAYTGGAVYVTGGGSKLNIQNTTFSKNTVKSAGGAILAQSTDTVIDINGCTFTGNVSNGSGGAIYASTNTTFKLDNSSFTGNTAEQGACLYALRANSTIGKVTMEGNKSATTKAKPTLRAAGIYVSGGEMTIDGAVFKNNQGGSGTAITTGVAKGTVDGKEVSFYPTVNFVSGTITGNKGISGGAILLQSKTVFNMKSGKISGNSASDGGAIYVSTNATFNMTGGTISNNTAKNNGGAIYGLRSEVNLKSGTISGNFAEKMGGAIFLSGAKLYQSGAYISGNKTGTGTGGGAIATGVRKEKTENYHPYIKISGGTITDNYGRHGGAILLQGNSKTVLDMTGGKITNNQGKVDAGAIYVSTHTTINMTGGTISGNTCEGRAGAIFHNNSKGNYDGAEIFNNNAKSSGGALMANGATTVVKMKNSKIYDCFATTGGGIVDQGKARMTLEKTEIYNCHTTTGSGGAIYVSYNAYLDFIDIIIRDCQSKMHGGGAYFANHTYINADGLTVQNNVSEIDGGGIYTRSCSSVFKNMKLIGNKANGNAGGFYAANPAVQGVSGMIVKPDYKTGNVMENVEFVNNEAVGQAGGLYGHKGNFVTLKNATFTGNTSGVEGSAVYSLGDFIMNGLTVTGNTSKMDGYAVHLADVEYDGQSYSTGLNQMAGDVIIKDNQGGDLYMGETTTIAVLAEGIGEKTEIHVTLASGVLTNKVLGAYHYEGGDQVYTITYGDRSLTEPEYDEVLANANKEEKKAATDVVLYAGVGVFVLAVAAVVVLLILKKKKKAPVADGAQE